MNTTAIRRIIPLAQFPPVGADPPEFARWRDYPAGIGGYNSITTSHSLSARLSRLSSELFTKDINLHIIDINHIRGDRALYWARGKMLTPNQIRRHVRRLCMSAQLRWRVSCVNQMTNYLGLGSCKHGIKVL